MQCIQCQHVNPEGANFCNECAAPLLLRCPSCGTANRPKAKFCNERATPLVIPPPVASGQTSVARAKPATGKATHHQRGGGKTQESKTGRRRLPSAGHGAPEAECRQLTVLFCDLVDSTALLAHLDPEELREVVRAYQAVCAKVIQRFDGHIAQYLGDGLLVYFGYPLAHEDDAERVVRAGLVVIEAVAQLNTRLEPERGVHLAVRLGCHTGLVVVGDMGGGTRQTASRR
jgi:class 3 adenylate cyclase